MARERLGEVLDVDVFFDDREWSMYLAVLPDPATLVVDPAAVNPDAVCALRVYRGEEPLPFGRDVYARLAEAISWGLQLTDDDGVVIASRGPVRSVA